MANGQVEVARNSLKRLNPNLWRFSITMGGFIVNGFTYNEQNRRVMPPTCDYGNGQRRLVRAFGIHVIRLRDKIEEQIKEIEDGESGNSTRTE